MSVSPGEANLGPDVSGSLFSRYLAYSLGIVGLAGFFALSYTGMMGENYTKFFDEDVTFFDKNLDGKDDRDYYYYLMGLSFFLAFFSTLYRDTTRSVRNRLIAADDQEFDRLYKSFYGSRSGFLWISLFSVSWETVYETLWIFIALTDMFGVIFVLCGRFAGVLVMAFAFENRSEAVAMRLAKRVSSLSFTQTASQVSTLKF
jgi:hypothetical protein